MRFEGKHKFFKRVIRNAQNFKNVAMTLATKHKAGSYHLDCSSFFRPSVEMSNVTAVSLAIFPRMVQTAIAQNITMVGSLSDVSSVCIDGIKCHPGMILSAGSCSGLPESPQIEKIVAANAEILFVCLKMTAWYSEHLRCYELHCNESNRAFTACLLISAKVVRSPSRMHFHFRGWIIINQVGSAKFVSKFDLLKGYWQVPLNIRAQDISAFITPSGLYSYKVMPFGLRNGPLTFQSLMNRVVGDLEGCAVYLDDMVVYSDSWDSHVLRILTLFEHFAAARLTVNLAKCDFACATVTYLGHVVSQGRVRPVQAKGW